MRGKGCITIFIGSSEPKIYDLDSFGKEQLRLGRGPYHGNEGDPKNDIVIDADISFILIFAIAIKPASDSYSDKEETTEATETVAE